MGPSGSGKSALALEMIALGAWLVADDAVELSTRGGRLIGRAIAETPGLIEARYLGLLRLPRQDEVPVQAVADLGRFETERLPPARSISLGGVSLPLLLAPPKGHAAAALLLYLRHGRHL